MLNLITISISLIFILLTGWTITTYLIKKDTQKAIRKELTILFDICNKFLLSLKNLIGILANTSISTEEREKSTTVEAASKEDEKLLNFVQPSNEINEESVGVKLENDDDEDEALSSFSPEVVMVISEEEEKVA